MHRSTLRLGLAFVGGLAALTSAGDARAQGAGSAGRPLPNVLLLVDNSGSMERKPDNNLPTCVAGNTSTSETNRWGMLLQALTGNFQPGYSCAAVSRIKATNPAFAARYSIAGKDPYDTDYFLPYNQPMTGTGADACVISPWKLPGASGSDGVGSFRLGAGGSASDYPDDALVAYKYARLGTGVPAAPLPATDTCSFDQNSDGQLDVSKAYARFALMTFDSSTDPQTGVTGTYPAQVVNGADPFKGMWSYTRTSGNPFFSDPSNTSSLGLGAQGMPGTEPACPPTFQEVGARHFAAPPWEGRLIGFPHPDATLYDLDAQNALIQQTLLATRPYGATPIDGLMDDARDYLLNHPNGPRADPYECRDKYIILLTDGAPNLNLRPSCTQANGVCPFPKQAHTLADEMFTRPGANKITTYVIGFSVNGTTSGVGNDGFPAGLSKNDCKTWFDKEAGSITNETAQAKAMNDVCEASPPAAGTTGEACCMLNRIAYRGSGTGAYFAESQADIVLAFGRIMANIIHSASTKTLPAFAPATNFSTGAFQTEATAGTKASAAQFIASYIPSAQVPWSGEIDRSRYLCKDKVSDLQTPARPSGDYQSENLARQSADRQRLFISVVGDTFTSAIDSAATIRPFAGNVDAIGNPNTTGTSTYVGREVAMRSYNLDFETDWARALNINDKTCKSGRAVGRAERSKDRGTVLVPALTDPKDCTDVVWSFAAARPGTLLKGPSGNQYDFNVRCAGNSTSAGVCSISGTSCDPAAANCPTGETCVPACTALGAIYHSTPAIQPPPTALLREEGFRNYQAKYARRRTVMYTATTDGLLHAFDAMLQAGPEGRHELWSFAPPAVLPKLASNYPGGNQILLDGAPVVRETVWDRRTSQLGDPKKWHSTLVAGLGTLGGYYAINVTDSDCSNGTGTDNCLTKYETPDRGSRQHAGLPVDLDGTEGTAKLGPHFLWQLTDVPGEATDPESRRSTIGPATKTKMTALFGRNTGTPAVGMVQVKQADGEHQLGIAVLPGGYSDPPIVNATTNIPNACNRGTKPGDVNISDTGNGAVRAQVRQWSKGGCDQPVPGRSLSIVRLDTGEVLRVFGRRTDVPSRLWPKLEGNGGVTETIFDSPMVGTPVLYPDQPGVPVQKIFIGDADGTLWRIDVRSTDPRDWKAYLFADLMGKATSPNAAASQPIQVPPVLSTDDAGMVVVNAASGDQESIVASDTLENFVYSIRERRDGSNPARAEVLWFKRLERAERVTGPMTVFDKTLYYATYRPIRPTGTTVDACNGPGRAYLWGMHYMAPNGGVASANGGLDRWCPVGAVDISTGGSGLCTLPFTANEAQGQDIIPGVALTTNQSCVGDPATDEYGNTMFSSVSQASYSLSFGISRPNTEKSNKAQAARGTARRPLPRMATQISSWSLVLE